MADYDAYIYCPCGASATELAAAIAAAGTVLPTGGGDTIELGVDIACIDDIASQFSLVGGMPNVAMALLRRLSTPRGGLLYDGDYGLDLRDYLSAGIDQRELSMMGPNIEAECLKDERVQGCEARVTYIRAESALRVRMRVLTATGPFQFIMAVSSVTVELLNAGLGTPTF